MERLRDVSGGNRPRATELLPPEHIALTPTAPVSAAAEQASALRPLEEVPGTPDFGTVREPATRTDATLRPMRRPRPGPVHDHCLPCVGCRPTDRSSHTPTPPRRRGAALGPVRPPCRQHLSAPAHRGRQERSAGSIRRRTRRCSRRSCGEPKFLQARRIPHGRPPSVDDGARDRPGQFRYLGSRRRPPADRSRHFPSRPVTGRHRANSVAPACRRYARECRESPSDPLRQLPAAPLPHERHPRSSPPAQ